MLLVACNEDEDPNEFVQGQGNTVQVLLDSRLDSLVKDSASKMTNGLIDYRLKPGSLIPEPGVTKDTKAPVLEGFLFVGYFEGTVKDDGTVEFGAKWDFSRHVSKNMTLYGKWEVQYKIRINYVLNGQLVVGQYEDVNVADNAASVVAIKEPSTSWSQQIITFVQLYDNVSCAKGHEIVVSAAKPFEHGCTEETPICNVYAQFIEGDWLIVRKATDLKTIYAGSQIYLLADVDMSQLGIDSDGYTKWNIPEDFIGIIEGNGYTISNLNFKRKGTTATSRPITNYSFGLFAVVNNATVRNVTFKDCIVTGVVQKTNDEYFYGFFAGQATGECTFENITFDNVKCAELKFELLVGELTPEEELAERAHVTQGVFVGEGSTFTPKII